MPSPIRLAKLATHGKLQPEATSRTPLTAEISGIMQPQATGGRQKLYFDLAVIDLMTGVFLMDVLER